MRARLILAAAALLPAVLLTAAPAWAQSLDQRVQMRTERQAEQRQPRTAVAFDPAQFDKFAGVYQRAPYEFFTITRRGEHFVLGVEMPGLDQSHDTELYPESPTKFFAKDKPVQVAFTADARGRITGFVQHGGGFEVIVPKVGEATVKRAMAEAEKRIKTQTPHPGAEGKLRRFIEGFQRGQPNYDEIDAESAVIYRTALLKDTTDQLQKLGALTSLTLVEVPPTTADKYLAVGEHGRAHITIDFAGDGRIDSVQIAKIETP